MLITSVISLIILGIAYLLGLKFTVIAIIILIIAILAGLNTIGISKIRKKFEAIKYGVKVNVNGLNMNVSIIGEQNDITIVTLPGLGVISPIISYKAFVESLADKFKIITVEPFGYGISDITKEERTNKNYISELHTCLQKLGIKKYYLMAHSISGIYSLSYANKYPEEVLGFIGLDNTPKNIDFPRTWKVIFFMTLNSIFYKLCLFRFVPENLKNTRFNLDSSYHYTDEEKKYLDIIYYYTSSNPNISDESKNLDKNVKDVALLNFPEHIPVIMFLASNTCKKSTEWEELHKNMKNHNPDSEIIILEGSHFIFLHQRKAIADKLKTWIK